MARGRQPAGAFGARAAASRSSGHAAAAGKHKGRSRFARAEQRPAAKRRAPPCRGQAPSRQGVAMCRRPGSHPARCRCRRRPFRAYLSERQCKLARRRIGGDAISEEQKLFASRIRYDPSLSVFVRFLWRRAVSIELKIGRIRQGWRLN